MTKWLNILIKALNKKILEEKKFILAKDIDSKRKFAYFLGHPNSGSCVKNA